ncbi:MAG TPA: hypothetical protein VF921_09155 [Vicinamibacterales bacterium]
MGRIKSTLSAVCAATLLTVAMAAAQGTLADRKTIVTFSGPVSVPGTTLAAGTYVFKLADSAANRNIVQIFDRDEAKIITTLMAVPAERAEQEGDPVVSFKETPSDRPPAVKYWYYAGEKAGNEFVYPKAQAMMIASSSGDSVSTVETDSTDMSVWKKSKVTKVTSSSTSTTTASTASTTTEPMPAASTTTAPTTTEPTTSTTTAPTTTAPTTTEPPPPPVTTAPVTAEPATVPPPVTAPVTVEPAPVATSGRSEALPHTASQLPLVGLIGLFALAMALGVRAMRHSVA